MTKLKDLLIPTTVKNYAYDDTPIVTKDLVFIDSFNRLKSVPTHKRLVQPTDFASEHILNSSTESKLYTSQILSDYNYIDTDGEFYEIDMIYDVHGVCPCIHVKFNNTLIENIKTLLGQKSNINGKILYHTLKFGVYPQERRELEYEYSIFPHLYFTKTGKKFVDTTNNDFSVLNEYLHDGKKYIRYISYDKSVDWFEVQPIIWRIRNWKDLPKTINPQGSGTAKYLDLKSEKALLGLYLHDDFLDNWNLYKDLVGNKNAKKLEENCCLWQNSIVRGFLNGIDVNYIKNANGNPAYSAPSIQNFEKNNFIKNALDIEISDFIKIENPFYGKDFTDLD